MSLSLRIAALVLFILVVIIVIFFTPTVTNLLGITAGGLACWVASTLVGGITVSR